MNSSDAWRIFNSICYNEVVMKKGAHLTCFLLYPKIFCRKLLVIYNLQASNMFFVLCALFQNEVIELTNWKLYTGIEMKASLKRWFPQIQFHNLNPYFSAVIKKLLMQHWLVYKLHKTCTKCMKIRFAVAISLSFIFPDRSFLPSFSANSSFSKRTWSSLKNRENSNISGAC